METTIVHEGKQSALLFYDNTVAPSSEVTANVAYLRVGRDWTASSIQNLSLYFHGAPDNSGRLYLKINNTKVSYKGLPDALQRAQWMSWTIDLAAAGADLCDG